jgi:imidazole glycerol-phosphate synthase subunit HisF
MLHSRIIPCLLLRYNGLFKTIRYKDARYIGDPINAVRILNDKEVDELVFLDIGLSGSAAGPNFELLEDIASEAFMPFAYGGGVKNIDQIKHLYSLGIEKVIINSAAIDDPKFVYEAASLAGSSGVVVSIDVKKNWLGKYLVYKDNGKNNTKLDPVEHAIHMESLGAGEIILSSIDLDGTMEGYDLELTKKVTDAVNIPVTVMGGAGKLADFREVIESGAAAAAAGSMFVFHGKHKAVLITYPEYKVLEELFL